ncbi:MAG: response regulator [Flavobacteriaceae bacterium]
MAQHINPKPDSALYYVKKIQSLSTSLNYGIGQADSHYLFAQYYRRIQKIDSSIYHFHKLILISEEIPYARGLAIGYNGLCRVNYLVGNMEEAEKNCQLALEWASKFEDIGNVVFSDTNIALASTYIRQNKLEQAINKLLKVDSLHKKTPIRPDIIAAAYQSLGNIYLDLKDFTSSEKYFLLANEAFGKMPVNNSFYLQTTNHHLGQVYYHQKKYAKADSLLTSAHQFFKQINDNRTLASVSTYLGLLNSAYKKNTIAETYFKEALELHKKYDFDYEASQAGIELSKLYLSQNRPNDAISLLNKVLQYNIGNKNTLIRLESFSLLSEAYAHKKDFGKAYEMLNSSMQLKDSLQQAQSAEKIREIEAIYQTESRDREIELLTSQNEIVNQQKKNQLILLLAGLGLTALIGLFFFVQYKNRIKTNKKLRELDQAKSAFFANISHEFRTPLTLIKGPIEDQLAEENLPTTARKNLTLAKFNTHRLEGLVEQLLALSKLESGAFKLRVQPGNILPFASAQAALFQFSAEGKNIDYSINIPENNEKCWYDTDALEKVFSNLIGNAIKYTPENGKIIIKGDLQGNYFNFKITNTGTYLTPEEQTHIFKRFYQTNPLHPGTGIGLSLTKELIELHKGTIKVSSNSDKKTEFEFKIPVSKQFFNADEILSEALHYNPVETLDTNLNFESVESLPNVDETIAPILLVVDDNPAIRSYTASIFENTYKIEMASNGKEALTIAKEVIPDIIISDVMMPEVDGFQFSESLKQNEFTSHIPIILLTARTEEEEKLKGIHSGADGYVTKPFSARVLKATVKNLIENRRKLQMRFSQEVILRPKDIAISSADEKFLENLQKVMDTHITNPDFSAEIFSKEMGVSRMQLHRKLRAITGQSTTEFIRSQRLKLATTLLSSSSATISEIAFSVGFNDPSYFTKCFKQEFGYAPSDYPSAQK